MLLKVMIVFVLMFTFLYFRNFLKFRRKKIFFKAKKLTTFNKKNLNNWMNLTKKERYNLSKQESVTYFDERKLLLEEIRKEYKSISTNDQKSL